MANPSEPATFPPMPAKAMALPSGDQLGASKIIGSGRTRFPPPASLSGRPPAGSTLFRIRRAGLSPNSTNANRGPSGAAAIA